MSDENSPQENPFDGPLDSSRVEPAVPDPGRADPPQLGRSARTLLITVVIATGVAGALISQALGRLDSALLFVGVPCLLALLLGLVPTKDINGTVFKVVTVTLLLSSALLHEGALCVLLASPLVYLVAFGVTAIVKAASERGQSFRLLLLPLIGVAMLEGALPGLRIGAEQDATAHRVMAAECGTFERALARGPRIGPEDRGTLLHLAKYPTPTATASTDGLAEGSTWTLTMPDGAITTTVTGRDDKRLDFAVQGDTARTTRWVTLRSGSLTWQQTDEGCVADLTIDYRRHLDPAFWFGPITEVFMDAGASAFLASLD